ncbi:hypothetical protein HFN89_01715 [Rhizobium laguerreae]|nr:hypothetical protein [Rhizobium laguerreae]
MAKRAAHLFGIRHHGPGSAALLKRALDKLDPASVLIEGPPECDRLIADVDLPGMKPPVAMMAYATVEASNATFFPFAEFSPEWVAMRWALERGRSVRFIDWPAAVSLAAKAQGDEVEHPLQGAEEEATGDIPEGEAGQAPLRGDVLDVLAEMAGYGDGEAFWNGLIEQGGGSNADPLDVFAAIELAMTEARAFHGDHGPGGGRGLRDASREAFMRGHIRDELKKTEGEVAVVVGAWHVGGLRKDSTVAEDKAITRDLPRVKVEVTWSPWSDGRLSIASGYGAGVISPGWYRHLWGLYSSGRGDGAETFAAVWQSKTAALMRERGFSASTASAIEATRLALGLASVRNLSFPGITEMRDASLAALCHGDEGAFEAVEQALYIGSEIGEIDGTVPLMPLARDFDLWCRRTRMKPSEEQTEINLDLRTEVGLARSTLLHRLDLINVRWGRLVDAEAGRGTFREIWKIAWSPDMTVGLAEAVVWGLTIEQAASGAVLERAKSSDSVADLAELVRSALIADLPDAATLCIGLLQAAAVQANDITDLMFAVVPLARIARYGTSRKLPEAELRALITALGHEINAGVRTGSHQLDDEAARKRVEAMRGYDDVLVPFGDDGLVEGWHRQLGLIVDDEQAVAQVKGLSLRRLHDRSAWAEEQVAAAFSRHIVGEAAVRAGAFVENFISGSAEILIQDQSLLALVDEWLCGLDEPTFIESLPLLRRALSSFDEPGRRRLMQRVAAGRQIANQVTSQTSGDENTAFDRALPLLHAILGIAA